MAGTAGNQRHGAVSRSSGSSWAAAAARADAQYAFGRGGNGAESAADISRDQVRAKVRQHEIHAGRRPPGLRADAASERSREAGRSMGATRKRRETQARRY